MVQSVPSDTPAVAAGKPRKRKLKAPRPGPAERGRKRLFARRPAEPAAATPLRPYTPDHDTRRHRGRRRNMLIGLVAYCFIYGFVFAFLAPYAILFFLAPLVIAAMIVVWALPDSAHAPVGLMELLFYSFFVTMIIWPNYIAIALPGLPWITLIRLTGFPLLFALLVCISTSSAFRKRLGETLNATPMIWRLVVAFVVIQTISIVFSHDLGNSIDKYIVAQVSWTTIFFVSCYLFLKPGRVVSWAAVLWGMAIVVGVIGLYEYRHATVPWAGHIPHFLAVNDPNVERILAGGGSRTEAGAHRVQSTFTTPLGLAEYLALTLPFVVGFIFGRYKLWVRIAAGASVPFIFYIVILSDSRLGAVGCLLTLLLYLLAWAALDWHRNKNSIFGPAITLAFPLIAAASFAATFVVGRLHAMVWGNGFQQYSTQGRVDQYKAGLPMVLKAPLGHGIGMGADTLGFFNGAGVLTIDTYYLCVLLEYGILGFIVYYGVLLVTIHYAGKYALSAEKRGRDFAFLVPVAIALVNFFIIKSVFSQQDNHPLIYMMMGMVVALVARAHKEDQQKPAATDASVASQAVLSPARPAGVLVDA